MEEDHVGVLHAHLVERVPDALVIVAFSSAREGDARSLGKQDLVLGAAFLVEEITAVDHRGGQGPMVDHRSRAGAPGRARVNLVGVRGFIAQELEAVATLDQRLALIDEAFELDRSNLGAVLLALRAALRDLIMVELELDPVELAMKGVYDAPEDFGQIVF